MPGLYSATDEERRAAEEEVARGLAAEASGEDTSNPTPTVDIPPTPDFYAEPDLSLPEPKPIQGAGTFEAAEEGVNRARSSAQQVASAQRQLGGILADKADNAVKAHEGLATEQTRQAEELAKQDQAQREGEDRAHRIAEEAQQQFKDFKFSNWWDRQDTGTKILTNISLFLGGLMQRRNGGENKALTQINRVIEADFRDQREKLGQLKTFAEWKRQGELDLAGRYRTETAKLTLKQARATMAAAEQAKAEILRNDGDEAMAQNNVVVRSLVAKADADMAKALQTLAHDKALEALAAAKMNTRPGAMPMTPEMAKLADMAGDPNVKEGELRGYAAKAGIPVDVAEKIINNSNSRQKPPEGQQKSATQAVVGLKAIEKIHESKYQPDRDAIQKWLNNQRLVAGAEGGGVKGLALTIGQNLPGKLVPQSEFEGLDPKAQEYFTNVRRYMESIGRWKSGAAISSTEWTNFYNQYGPNAKGGLDAAKYELDVMGRLSGVAGAQARSVGAKSEETEEEPTFTRKPGAAKKATVTDADRALLRELEGTE
jgi:hypothetical protein